MAYAHAIYEPYTIMHGLCAKTCMKHITIMYALCICHMCIIHDYPRIMYELCSESYNRHVWLMYMSYMNHTPLSMDYV